MIFQRRQYIIDSVFQWKYAARFVSVALIGSIAAAFVFKFFAEKRLQELEWRVQVSSKIITEALTPLFVYVNFLNFIFVAALLIITGLFMMRRITGPVYRIVRGLEVIRKGDMSHKIILREKDEFRDVAGELNRMVEKVNMRFAGYLDEYEETSDIIKSIESDFKRGGTDKKKLEAVAIQVNLLKRRMTDEL